MENRISRITSPRQESAYIASEYEQGDLLYSAGPHEETALAITNAVKKLGERETDRQTDRDTERHRETE